MSESIIWKIIIPKFFLPVIVILFTFFVMDISAQNLIKVTGEVTNLQGAELIGVSVYEKSNTKNGVVTDINGRYAITLGENAILVFSYIGHKTIEINVSGRKTINVELAEDAIALQEVVAVGYGTMKKTDLTGAVAQVKMQEMEGLNMSSIDRGLQGKLAGVTVMQNSGEPGGGVTIRVRGGNSISGNNEPLYVIDGFPIRGSSSTGANQLASINPNDILSIEVLKDAASTSIYGAEGSNGVILITTKSGESTKGKLQINALVSYAQISNRLDIVNKDEFILLRDRAYKTGTGKPFWEQSYLDEVLASGLTRYESLPDTDWQELMFNNIGKTLDFNAALAGTTQKTNYRLSLGFYDQEGIVKKSDFNRLTYRYNFNSVLSEKLTVGGVTSASYVKGNFASTTGSDQVENIIQRISYSSPLLAPFDSQGNLLFEDSNGDITTNPLAMIAAQDKNFERSTFNLNAFAEFSLTQDLKLKITGGVNSVNAKNNEYLSKKDVVGYALGGRARVNMITVIYWINENILTYTKKFGLHDLTLLGVFSQKYDKTELINVSAQNFANESLTYYNLSAANQHNPIQSGFTDKKGYSYVGRANYSYKDRYLATAIIRADGDSRFAENNKFGYFPSLSAAWRVSEESFFKQSFNGITNFKIRTGIGRTGNPGIQPYASLPKYQNDFYIIDNKLVTGYASTSMGNSNLKWETTDELNAGIDLSLRKPRINFSIDVYSKITNDLLLTEKLPLSSGYATTWNNVGQVSNKGVEISFDGRAVQSKNFGITYGVNFSYNQNMVINAGSSAEGLFGPGNGALQIQNPIILREGEPLGSFFGYKYIGVWQQEEEATAALYDVVPGTGEKAKPGDPKYMDVNNDSILDNEDKMVLGNAMPIYNLGVNLSVRYKRFTLSASGNGAFGHKIFNMNSVKLTDGKGAMSSRIMLDAWRAPGTDGPEDPGFVSTTIPRVNSNNKLGSLITDRWIEKGDYFKISNISLAYNATGRFTKALGLSNLRLSVSAQDLFMFSSYTGFTPEVNSHPGSNLNLGFDAGGYPPSRMVNFGVNASF